MLLVKNFKLKVVYYIRQFLTRLPSSIVLRPSYILLSLTLFLVPVPRSLAATLINDTETEKVIAELIAPLGTAANIPHGRLKIYIVNDNSFNAFVRSGEDLFVYTGLLMQVKSANALRAVVAHELRHMTGGHIVQMSDRINAEMKRAMLIQALGIGLMVAGGNPSMGAGVLAGSSGVAQQSMLAFTRDEERIADNMGVELMVKAGFDPSGFIEVFEHMNQQMGATESKINPSRVNHPLTGERLKNVKEKLKNIKERGTGTRNEDEEKFTMVRAKLTGYLDSPSRVRELYPSSDTSNPALYARAIANMRAGNLAGAKTGTLTLVSRRPDNPYFYELLGDIEYQYGHYDDSVDAYEKSLKLSANAPQIQTALALVLTERRRPDDITRAIELSKRALLAEPSPLTYWVLARAYDKDDRADWAMAEYYNMQDKKDKAKEYAKRARSKLAKDSPEYIKSGELLK